MGTASLVLLISFLQITIAVWPAVRDSVSIRMQGSAQILTLASAPTSKGFAAALLIITAQTALEDKDYYSIQLNVSNVAQGSKLLATGLAFQ